MRGGEGDPDGTLFNGGSKGSKKKRNKLNSDGRKVGEVSRGKKKGEEQHPISVHSMQLEARK